jgi:hypothetical protein
MLACSVGASVLSIAPRSEDTQRALIYAPWTSGPEAMRRAATADVDLVGVGRYPFIVIVSLRAANETSSRDSGALLSIAADALGGCLKASLRVTS